MKIFLVIMLFAVLFFIPVSGTERGDGSAFELKKHEIALSGAFMQGEYVWGYDFNKYSNYADLYSESIAAYNKEKISGCWGISYTYNFNKLIALQLGINYEACKDCYHSKEDGSKLSSVHGRCLSEMATIRVSWLNRRIIRVYSSAGIGVLEKFFYDDTAIDGKGKYDDRDIRFVCQVAPIGIAIGKKLFGFMELGVGSVYVGDRFGVGFRF